jgi:hypothetical protein
MRQHRRPVDISVEMSGPHDFTVREWRIRQRAIRVHRIPPNVRDDGQRPSERDGMIRFYCCFYRAVKRNFGKSEIGRAVEPTPGQLSFRYGHFSWLGNRTIAMDRTVARVVSHVLLAQ